MMVGVLFLTPGCKDEKEAKKATPEKREATPPPEKKVEAEPKVSPNWSDRAVEPVAAEVDGLGFTVSLPKGLKQEIKEAKDPFPGYVNWTWPGSFDMPSFTAQLVTFPPSDLADAKRKLESFNKYKTTFEETLDDGYLVAVQEDGDQYLNVQVWRTVGDKTVRFSVMQRNSEAIPGVDSQREWMLKVCRSFDAK